MKIKSFRSWWAQNQAENLIHAAEKSLDEFKDSASEDEASSIKGIITDLQGALSEENLDKIKEKSEELAQISGKFAEKAYKEKAGTEDPQSEPANVSENSKNEGDVVDADFEEIKDGETKNEFSLLKLMIWVFISYAEIRLLRHLRCAKISQ